MENAVRLVKEMVLRSSAQQEHFKPQQATRAVCGFNGKVGSLDVADQGAVASAWPLSPGAPLLRRDGLTEQIDSVPVVVEVVHSRVHHHQVVLGNHDDQLAKGARSDKRVRRRLIPKVGTVLGDTVRRLPFHDPVVRASVGIDTQTLHSPPSSNKEELLQDLRRPTVYEYIDEGNHGQQ